jgi:hypothetical protein
MPLNPVSYENEEEFKKDLNEKGTKNGWTLVTEIYHSVVQHVVKHETKASER